MILYMAIIREAKVKVGAWSHILPCHDFVVLKTVDQSVPKFYDSMIANSKIQYSRAQ